MEMWAAEAYVATDDSVAETKQNLMALGTVRAIDNIVENLEGYANVNDAA